MSDVHRPPWRHTPLTWVFLNSTGSDAAGNTMGSAFKRAFVELGAIAVGSVALLFLVIPHRSTRIVMTVLLGLISLVLPVLL